MFSLKIPPNLKLNCAIITLIYSQWYGKTSAQFTHQKRKKNTPFWEFHKKNYSSLKNLSTIDLW